MEEKYFELDEARNFIGKRIRTLRDLPNVPKGTCGFVVKYHNVCTSTTEKPMYGIVIAWLLPRNRTIIDIFSLTEFQAYLERC